MYMHIDGNGTRRHGGYNVARVGVAICDTVDGDYKYLKSFRPLGHESRDIGQFIDDDGTAYLIFEDRPNGFHIAKLRTITWTSRRILPDPRCTWKAARWCITRGCTTRSARA